MKKAALICSILLFSIFAIFCVSCGGGGGGVSAARGGNNAGKGFGGGGSGEVKVYVNGKLAGGSSGGSGGSEEMPANASAATYSAGIMSLDWSTMDFKLWVNGQLYFNQTLNKGDKFSVAGLKLGDNVRAEGSFTTSDGKPYFITGGIPSVQNGSKLSMYVTYKFECDASSLPDNVYVPLTLTGTYTAETGAALPAIQCLDGRTVLGWVVKNTGLPSDGKVWKSIPAGTTGNLELELVETKSLGGQPIFDVSSKTITGLTPYGETLTTIKIPEGVEEIGSLAFDTSSFSSVVLPSTLKKIDAYAFSDTSLTGITIPANVELINSFAFNGCSSLSNVTFASDSKLKKIDTKVFENCSSLRAVTIPANIESLGVQVFKDCTNLEKVEFAGNKIKKFEDYTFQDCTKLNSVSLPDSLEEISIGAFKGCTALRNITIPQNVNKICQLSFSGCSVTLTMKPLTPPVLESNVFTNPSYPLEVFVPGSALSAYKTASGWVSYAGRIN